MSAISQLLIKTQCMKNGNAYQIGFETVRKSPLGESAEGEGLTKLDEQNIANLVFFLGKHRNVCDRYCSACERVKELKCVCHTPDACDLESLQNAYDVHVNMKLCTRSVPRQREAQKWVGSRGPP